MAHNLYAPKLFTVKVRRDLGVEVLPRGEVIDGLTHLFTHGWVMGEGDHSMYLGEVAYIPDRYGWPIDGPSWVASGDLVEVTPKEGS
jgi:hypothetical protein